MCSPKKLQLSWKNKNIQEIIQPPASLEKYVSLCRNHNNHHSYFGIPPDHAALTKHM